MLFSLMIVVEIYSLFTGLSGPRVATGGGKFRHSVEVDDEILDDLWKRRPFFRQEIDQCTFTSFCFESLRSIQLPFT